MAEEQPTNYKRNVLTAIGGVVAASIVGIIVRPDSAALIIGFGTLISTQLFTQLKNAEAAAEVKTTLVETAHEQAAKVAEVKTALAESDAKTDTTLGKIHTLVNSNMGEKLTELEKSYARIYAMTNDPKDKIAWLAAKGLLDEHMIKQAVVDERSVANGEDIEH